MATLKAAMPFLMKHEGGWSNRRADRGGPTMHGVTMATATRILGITTIEALRGISDDDVLRVYREYWSYTGVSDQRLATKCLDLGVNFGDATEKRMIQVLVGVKPDGVFGPETVAAVNEADPVELMVAIGEAAVSRYDEIVRRNPDDAEFLAGWLIRARDMPV